MVLPLRGRLIEDVDPEVERHYRLVIPELLPGTLLHRQLEWREAIEVSVGCEGERHINIFCAS